jgi:hypothetical protein
MVGGTSATRGGKVVAKARRRGVKEGRVQVLVMGVVVQVAKRRLVLEGGTVDLGKRRRPGLLLRAPCVLPPTRAKFIYLSLFLVRIFLCGKKRKCFSL